MTLLTQSELFVAMQQYVQHEADLVLAAKSAVVDWKYANEQMYGPFPLFAEIGFRGSGTWQPAKRRWLKKQPAGSYYLHGLDAKGQVIIIERRNGIVSLFFTTETGIDEVVFGGRATSLKRYVFADSRPVEMYNYNLDPHQYSYETFTYDHGKLIESFEQSWFIKNGQWTRSSSTTRYTYEYDNQGLARAYRDRGERLGGKTLVFLRPGSESDSKGQNSRRPFVAYTIGISGPVVPGSTIDREYEAYADAYGLEMNIDDKWPIDTVILAPVDLVQVITKKTKVTSSGHVFAGASSIASNADLKVIKAAEGTWLMLSAAEARVEDHARAALEAGLNLILSITDPIEVNRAFAKAQNVTPDRLVVAFSPDDIPSPESAQAKAARIRSELKQHDCVDSRIVIASALNQDQIPDYLSRPDLDGMLYQPSNYGTVVDTLAVIAMCRR